MGLRALEVQWIDTHAAPYREVRSEWQTMLDWDTLTCLIRPQHRPLWHGAARPKQLIHASARDDLNLACVRQLSNSCGLDCYVPGGGTVK